MLKTIFGGTFGYVQAFMIITIGASLLLLWNDYKGAKADVTRLEGELVQEQAISASQRLTINSQARSNERRTQSNTQQQQTEDAINDVPDSTNCASSEPIKRGFNILRERADAKANDNP